MSRHVCAHTGCRVLLMGPLKHPPDILDRASRALLSAEKQQAAASIEADKASTASAGAAAIEKDAEKELAQAEPAMLAAAEAVNCLSKAMLTELKSLPKPPAGVDKARR